MIRKYNSDKGIQQYFGNIEEFKSIKKFLDSNGNKTNNTKDISLRMEIVIDEETISFYNKKGNTTGPIFYKDGKNWKNLTYRDFKIMEDKLLLLLA